MKTVTTTSKRSKQKRATTPEVLLERYPYRFVQVGTLEINGRPDCRIQKYKWQTKRWNDIYLCDNELQLMTAMEDIEYTKWLDPDEYNCYRRDVSTNPYPDR